MSVLTIAASGAPDHGYEMRLVTSGGMIFKGTVTQLVDGWVQFSKCTISSIHNMASWEGHDVVVSGDHVVAAWRIS